MTNSLNAQGFLETIKARRTIYGIGKEAVVSDQTIQSIIEEAIQHTPSAFNSQSARVVVLFGEHHDKLWDITTETLRKIVPQDSFEPTQQRMNGFKNGYATVLFFEDMAVVESLQQQFEAYKDNFPTWSQQSNGMLQLVIWTALEAEGLGANLQHYNPLIDDEVKQQWSIPATWKLIAQMPFGKKTVEPNEKEFKSVAEKVKFVK
ncbi:nitroreductase family protein [Paenibacillus sp. 1001270B_150601_E10]|uniref:nitroreductase family protein n=1 Tax=Paenibacillus sp. 1001270B_150601_E10 TaxID=2787079 RepID=UPI00189F4531|nr:nitroreductase family protein [Paenibacillus sp. 1001270B_150601_E10]